MNSLTLEKVADVEGQVLVEFSDLSTESSGVVLSSSYSLKFKDSPPHFFYGRTRHKSYFIDPL